MSTMPIPTSWDPAARPVRPGATPRRRVRHQARETVAVMAFSAAMSVVTALFLLMLLGLGK